MKAFFGKRKNRVLPIVMVSLALPVALFFEAPLEVYANNLEELSFSLRDFLPFCLAFWFFFAFLTAAVLFLLPEKLYRVACLAAAAAGLMLFVQGTYLNFGASSLPGDNLIGQTFSKGAIAADSAVWLLVIGAAIGAAFVKKADLVKPLSLLLAVIVLGTQMISALFLMLSTENIFLTRDERMRLEDPDYTPSTLGGGDLTALGASNNVVVFIIDRFDAAYAKTALERDPDLFDELTGFTWFQDAVSRYNHTYPSVAWMLTNTPYSVDMDRRDYLDSAYQGDIPLTRLHEAGYAVHLYTQDYYAYTDGAFLPDYIGNLTASQRSESIPLTAQLGSAAKMAQVSLYRCLPIAMKGLLGAIDSELDKYYRAATAPENSYSLNMKDVYDAVTQTDFTLAGEKNFSFIHVDGCHSVLYDENWQPASDDIRGDYAVSVSTSFDIIDRYLQEMKRLGVYDKATIIITGDHPAAFGDEGELEEARIVGLFVKPSGSGDGALRLSDAQVSHEDLWATVFRSEGLDDGGDYGESVFDVAEGTDRPRHYSWHTWSRAGGGSLDEYTYEITGPGADFSNWEVIQFEHRDRFLMD